MKRFALLIFVCVLLVSLLSTTKADIPMLINYQGMLTNNSGDPLTGTYDINFKVYNASSGGDMRWEETQTDVAVTNGLFNVILGGATVGGMDLNFSEEYWLEIWVEGQQMSERLRFTSVGYAYRARVADSAIVATSAKTGGGWVDNGAAVRLQTGTDKVGMGINSPDEKLHVENATGDNSVKVRSANGCTSSIKLFESNNYGFELAYAGNDDKFHLWSRKFSDNEGIRMTWLKDGRVGIGTTDPERDLHIAGSGFTEIQLEKTNEPTNKWHMGIYEENFYITETDVGTWMTLKNGGNVGIGTTNPHSGLHVEGSMGMGITHVDDSEETDYHVTHSDRMIFAESSGWLYVLLPSAVGIAGRVYTIKATASWVWIVPYISSQKIDAWDGSGILLDNLGFVTLVSDGYNWWTISMHNASFY